MACVQLHLRPKRTSLDVRLHEPASAEDECPILQDVIASATLDIFPYPFLSQHPKFSAMTLQCGHTFHAMALIYHWARSGNVLCPVCRAGPGKGQCLAMNRLPKEWKYSLASRIRRERKQDREEEETHNRQLAMQHVPGSLFVIPPLELNIRIEAAIGVSPATWVLKTQLVEMHNLIVFDVPPEELSRIPYLPGTFMRLVPYTCMHILQPSDWFRTGAQPGGNFSASFCDRGRFSHINLTLAEDVFAALVGDLIMGQYGGGFQLLMLADH
jgi:hypothetical protein